MTPAPNAQDKPFRVEEATIDELHAAIKSGRTTCVTVVQQYIERVRAYNGVASLLVTEDGGPIPKVPPRPSKPRRFCPISTSTWVRHSNSGAWRRRRPTRPYRSNME